MLPSSKFSRFALAVGFLLTGLVALVAKLTAYQANTQLFSDLFQSGTFLSIIPNLLVSLFAWRSRPRCLVHFAAARPRIPG